MNFRCSGCGAIALPLDLDPYPFRCRRTALGDNIDHIVTPEPPNPPFPVEIDRNPFIRYRSLSVAHRVAAERGLTDADYVHLVRRLDASIESIDGRGFLVTPFNRRDRLSEELGLSAGLWVKDETGSVSGSHKARHLMGILIFLEVLDRIGLAPKTSKKPLSIASCGNAALAAAVLARAAGRSLSVFIPPDAEASVVTRLRDLGASITVCDRMPGEPGDPCYRAFRLDTDIDHGGALPFCCQGSDNGLTIDGGKTLGYEMLPQPGERLFDRIFIQVGGGALISSVYQAFADAVRLGRIPSLPRLCAVQTRAASPLKRAYDRVAARITSRLGASSSEPADLLHEMERAEKIKSDASPALIDEELAFAASNRSAFMWPWETAPESIARGILDDETYDWVAAVRGMLFSGGFPILASEQSLAAAASIGAHSTGIDVSATGSAGLAGLLELFAIYPAAAGEKLAVLFTGIRR